MLINTDTQGPVLNPTLFRSLVSIRTKTNRSLSRPKQLRCITRETLNSTYVRVSVGRCAESLD